jgi:hypothetical protein
MKKLCVLAGAIVLSVFLSGCEVSSGYGGSSAAVYGEYPSTYYGQTYYYPTYPTYYGQVRPHWRSYDRDHYWDRNHHWGRHRYYDGHYH